MGLFVRSVINFVKESGGEVSFIDPATNRALDQASPEYIAWPDAINRMVAK